MTENKQLELISHLLQLEHSFRHAETLQELAYIIVNDSRKLINYRQAAFWRADRSELLSVSSLAVIDNNAPYIIWLKRLCRNLNAEYADQISMVDIANMAANIATDWGEWLPPYAIWIPFSTFSGNMQTGLLLAREQPWSDSELYLLQQLSDAFAHAWAALAPKSSRYWPGNLTKKRGLFLALVFFAVLAFPVKQTVLAPATVIASKPTILRAAIDGVVDEFFIQPNDPVLKDQLLLRLDDTRIKNSLAISEKALALAKAEYRKNAQQAMYDQHSKSQLTILKSRIEQQQAELANMQDWLTRVEIKAPHEGVAIFADHHEWIGRPVKLGERILMLADAEDAELEIQLAVFDAINLQDGAEVVFYLNIDPISPIAAELYYAAYQAQVNSSNQLAYRLKARFNSGGKLPRIGLKGTAKVYGQKVPLIFYLFRRPFAALRQWLGI